jgi:hypothetical protein
VKKEESMTVSVARPPAMRLPQLETAIMPKGKKENSVLLLV